jgi:hypothetical protein
VPLLGFLAGSGPGENGKLGDLSRLADCMAAEGAELLSCAFLFGNANAAALAAINPAAGHGIFGPGTLFGPQQGFAFAPNEAVAGGQSGPGGQGAANPFLAQLTSPPGNPSDITPFINPFFPSSPARSPAGGNQGSPPPTPPNNAPVITPATPISEPWSLTLLGGGLVALALFRRRQVPRAV